MLWTEKHEVVVEGAQSPPGMKEINRIAADGVTKRLMDLRTGRQPANSATAKVGLFDCGGALNFTCKEISQENGTKTLDASNSTSQKGGLQLASPSRGPSKDIDNVAEPKNIELVRAIQSGLSERGFYRATIDGIYGNGTKRAISDYQRAMLVPIDGQPTRALLSHIQKR